MSAPNPPGTGRVARLARGKRPVYGQATAGQVNQLLAAVTALTAEVGATVTNGAVLCELKD